MWNTWQWRSLTALKTLSETRLVKLFKVPPKIKVLLLDTPFYRSLNLERYGVPVEYTKKRGAFLLMHSHLPENIDNNMEWIRYGTASGGSAANYGPSFKFDPTVAARQHAFWVPLEQFCEFPDKWDSFKKELTISIRLDDDSVPVKEKRKWFRLYFAELQRLQKEGVEV